MKKTKLFTLLRTFTKQEMKDLEKFISSPYFSPKRNLMPLFDILKKYHPSFDSSNLTEEKIFRKLNPGKKYDKKKSDHYLQVLVSDMTLLAEKFLAIELLQNEDGGYFTYNALSVALKLRNLNFQNVILKNMERIQKTDGMGFFFNEMYMMNEVLRSIYRHSNKRHEAFKYSQRKSLYFYGIMLWNLQLLVSEYLWTGEKDNKDSKFFKLLENSVNAFDPEIFENECYDDGLGTKQLILTNYYLIKSELDKDDENSLLTAIEFYKKNFHNIKRNVQWNFFVHILNTCLIRKKEIDILKYSLIGSDLIDFVVEKGIVSLYEVLPMSHQTFTQFLSFKIVVLEGNELKNFIDLMLKKVQSEHTNWLFEYSYAWLTFKNREYERTLEILSKFNNREIIIKNNATFLRIASLYSLGYIEEAIYNLDSYEHFIRNNENVSKEIGDYVSLLTNSLRSLIKCKTDSSSDNNYILNKIIDDNKNRNFHFWFKEEAEKLKSEIK
jgi:hypothetical protein